MTISMVFNALLIAGLVVVVKWRKTTISPSPTPPGPSKPSLWKKTMSWIGGGLAWFGKKILQAGKWLWWWFRGLTRALKWLVALSAVGLALVGLGYGIFRLVGKSQAIQQNLPSGGVSWWLIASIALLLLIAAVVYRLQSGHWPTFGLRMPTFNLSTGGATTGALTKSPMERFGWLVAIAGMLFLYFCISQVAPEFWREWRKSDGFLWMQVALIAGLLLWNLKGVAGTIGTFILIFATISGCTTSCDAMRGAAKVKAEAKAAKQAEFMSTNVVAQATARAEQVKQLNPVNRKWEYGYIKPPEVQGILPDRREETFEARIVYYDAARFDFVVFIPQNGTQAQYTWDRFANKTSGVWSQPNPANHGRWSLKPEGTDREGRPTGSFHGWETNFRDEITSIWLRPKD